MKDYTSAKTKLDTTYKISFIFNTIIIISLAIIHIRTLVSGEKIPEASAYVGIVAYILYAINLINFFRNKKKVN